jgi:hypothetical protein
MSDASDWQPQYDDEPLTRPGVIPWFRVYCTGMGLIYSACIAWGIWLICHSKSGGRESELDWLFGSGFVAVSLPLALGFFLALVLPKRRWAWIYGLVLICIGLSSACFLPVCLPVLIHWIKPATKTFFGFASGR